MKTFSREIGANSIGANSHDSRPSPSLGSSVSICDHPWFKTHKILIHRARNGSIFVMIAKRVIPCLDVHAGQVTRGVQFGKAEAGELRNVGDPVELALRYNEQGADEMVFFDITASAHGRATMVDVIERAADQCFMPLTVGGGLRALSDMQTLLKAGADKVSINSAALANPPLIQEGAEKFGSQCIV